MLCSALPYAYASPRHHEELWQEKPAYYQRNYLLLGAARAVPLKGTAKNFAPGKLMPTLAYRFHHSIEWYSGLGGQYFHLLRLGHSEAEEVRLQRLSNFALARLYLENGRLLRLYHPAYLSVGFRLFYLFPLKEPLLPTSRDEEFRREFGASLWVGLLLFSNDEVYLHAMADRWRGINSNRFHGAEFSLLFAKRL